MIGKTVLDADFYKYGNYALAIASGFGVQTRHDACLTVINGEIYAEKFGIQQTGPGAIKKIEKDSNRFEESYFEEFNKDCTLPVYYGYSDTYFVQTTITDVIHPGEEYAVADLDNGGVYQVLFDERSSNTLILNEFGQTSITNTTASEFKEQLGEKYQPLIKVE